MIFKLIKIFKVVDILFIIFLIINFIVSLIYNLTIKKYEPSSVITNETMTLLYNLVQGVFYYLAALFIEKWCKKNEK
jgi:hypothetical protein